MSKNTVHSAKLKKTTKCNKSAITENKILNLLVLYDNGELTSWIQDVKLPARL